MSLSYTPQYPVPGETVELSAAAESGGDTFVFALTSAPTASDLALGLLLQDMSPGTAPASALVAARENVQASAFIPDAGGNYAFSIYELRSTPGGVFALVGIQTATVSVVSFLDILIRTERGHGAVLRLGIVDLVGETTVGYIRSADLVDHTTEAAREAAQVAAVAAAVDGLVGATVTAALGDFLALAANLQGKLLRTAHYDTSTWHTADDTDNEVARSVAPKSVAESVAVVNAARASLVGHMTAVALSGTGVHTNDDTANTVVVAPAVTLAEARVLLSHLRTTYERHRVRGSGATPPVHVSAGGDTTNTLTSATLFDDVVSTFIDALEDDTPTEPTADGVGVLYAEQNAGMAPGVGGTPTPSTITVTDEAPA